MRGFGMTMDLKTGRSRQWVVGPDGVKRWADNNAPYEPGPPVRVEKHGPDLTKWDRSSANVVTFEGYRVLRYRSRDHQGEVKQHFEAWPPKPAKGVHSMLGIRDTAKAAMALCEQHHQQTQGAMDD